MRCDFGIPFFWLPAMILQSSCLAYVREFLEGVVKSLEAKKQKNFSRMWSTLVPRQSRSQKYIPFYPFSGRFWRTLRKRSIDKEGKDVRKIPQGKDEEWVMALSAVRSEKIFLLEYKQWIVKWSPGIGENLMKVHKEEMVKHPTHGNGWKTVDRSSEGTKELVTRTYLQCSSSSLALRTVAWSECSPCMATGGRWGNKEPNRALLVSSGEFLLATLWRIGRHKT